MRPLARSTRAGIFAGILLWHVFVVLVLLRQRVPLASAPEAVMTWLRLDETPLGERRDRDRSRSSSPISRAAATASAARESPAPSTAIVVTPRVDWYGQASRAARDQYSAPLPTPVALEPKPKIAELPPPGLRDTGIGQPRGFASLRCRRGSQPDAAGKHCLPKYPPLDTAGLPGRAPASFETSIPEVPKGRHIPNTPRAGPAMGGAPGR